ncbi:MAG: hypothetical protein VB108_01265 [Anaerolineaceae bacterium]|nr:hypothetical protein [Anaerolineaceae bacterium]
MRETFPEIVERVSNWHNSQSFDERERLCLSAIHEQWMQLWRDKHELTKTYRAHIRRMSKWQKNIEDAMKERLAKIEKEGEE